MTTAAVTAAPSAADIAACREQAWIQLGVFVATTAAQHLPGPEAVEIVPGPGIVIRCATVPDAAAWREVFGITAAGGLWRGWRVHIYSPIGAR